MVESRWRRIPYICCLLAGLVLTGGCGETNSNLQVSGKITQDGQPLEVSEDGLIMMVFYELENGQLGDHSYSASVDESGNYQAELTPGAYRVAVQLLDPYSEDVDKLGGAYDQMQSPITVEVAESQENLDIELSEP